MFAVQVGRDPAAVKHTAAEKKERRGSVYGRGNVAERSETEKGPEAHTDPRRCPNHGGRKSRWIGPNINPSPSVIAPKLRKPNREAVFVLSPRFFKISIFLLNLFDASH